ncbi:hypothetical protein NE857_17935 [Nocardiopsis exhalans]|uniref:Uncharacterized protein n=1 Tax=Nocardiopsis exhalans TaxID=163604 RepID=A0ABY5D036_9ACTN|nr:hypothetical protein [Nocardiopsis exhalans]USY17235.1 hypothetical protein NE857_17935 [Nocardiopsis exhalans]
MVMITVFSLPLWGALRDTALLVAVCLTVALPSVLALARRLRASGREMMPLAVIGAPGAALCVAALSSGSAALLAGIIPGGGAPGMRTALLALAALALPATVLCALLVADENPRPAPVRALARAAGVALAGAVAAAPVVEALLGYPGAGALLVRALLVDQYSLAAAAAAPLVCAALAGLVCAGLARSPFVPTAEESTCPTSTAG